MKKRGIAVLIGLAVAAVMMLNAIATGQGVKGILQALFALVIYLAVIELAKKDEGGEEYEHS